MCIKYLQTRYILNSQLILIKLSLVTIFRTFGKHLFRQPSRVPNTPCVRSISKFMYDCAMIGRTSSSLGYRANSIGYNRPFILYERFFIYFTIFIKKKNSFFLIAVRFRACILRRTTRRLKIRSVSVDWEPEVK